MSADTLTADGAAVVLTAPTVGTHGAFQPTGFSIVSGANDEIAIAWIDGGQSDYYGYDVELSAYSLNGSLIFEDAIAQQGAQLTYYSPSVASDPGVGVVIAWQNDAYGGHFNPNEYSIGFAVVRADGTVVNRNEMTAAPTGSGKPAEVYSTIDGFALQWNNTGITPEQAQNFEGNASEPAFAEFQRWDPAGESKSQDVTEPSPIPFADVAIGRQEFIILDNQADVIGQGTVTIPGEPQHAMTEVVAAGLADGQRAVVAWADSGTDYVSIYDSVSNSFVLPRVTVDWSGASDLHVVALNDGGFAVSWMKGGAYYGGLFDAAGNYGGKLSLAGEFATQGSDGRLYTVGADANGNEVLQAYTVAGQGGSAGGGSTGGSSGGSGGSAGGVDTLTAKGAAVDLPAFGGSETALAYTTIDGAYEVVVAYQSGPAIELVGYTLDGAQVFAESSPVGSGGMTGLQFSIASDGGAGFIGTWDLVTDTASGETYRSSYDIYDAAGHVISAGRKRIWPDRILLGLRRSPRMERAGP